MDKYLLKAAFRSVRGMPIAVTFWDGHTEVFGPVDKEEPQVRLIIKEKLDLKEMFREPEISFGEAYMDQKIDVEGDLSALFRLLILNKDLFRKDINKNGLLQRFMKIQKEVSPQEQAENVQYHYDLGNDFYKLWLDESMSYSCAYFKTPEDSLEEAQQQKVDYILRKLQLKAGESLLDIGCGWGCLIIKAAREYGVKSLGITLSKEQEEEARQRIRKERLEKEVEVRLADHRDLCVEGRMFDKIVSVGMFKHVGMEFIPSYFACLKNMLKPRGLSLLHTITRITESPTNPWVDKYIYPGSYIPSLRETISSLSEHHFCLLDVESMRLHYAMTTDCWARNFEKVAETVKAKYGERFVRMWRLYLFGYAASFQFSGLDVHQLLFSKGLYKDLPLTREYQYK